MRRTVLIYGLLGGVLITALKLIEYRFLVVQHSLEIYGGLVAAVFATLGIWFGLKLTRVKEVVKEVVVVRETHSSRLFDKLNARRRTQAVQIAKEAGLIA